MIDSCDMAHSGDISVIGALGMSVDELESMPYDCSSVEATTELEMVCISDDGNGEEQLVRNNCLSDEAADDNCEQSNIHVVLETEPCCENKRSTDYRVEYRGIYVDVKIQRKPASDMILSANQNTCSDDEKANDTLMDQCTVRNESQLYNHMELHDLVKQYICCYCSKIFKYRSHLLSHVNMHTHNAYASFACDICEHKFRSSSGVRKHRRIHDDVLRHKCSVCAKTFAFASVLAEHERIHSKAWLFLCDFCGLGFKQASNMRKHRRLMHEMHDESSCQHCGAYSQCVCLTKSSTASSQFQCPVCLKCFKNKSYKEMHLRVHSGERPYQCQMCELRFKQQSNLSKHMLSVHSGQHQFSCRFCGKTFAVKSNLNDHEKIHTGDRQFPCSLCPKRFITAAALRAHVRCHDNCKKSGATRSKVCANNSDTDRVSSECLKSNTCDREFVSVAAFHQHSAAHSSVQSFACQSCGNCFNTHHCHLHQGKEVNVVNLQTTSMEWVTCEVQIPPLSISCDDSLVLPMAAADELCQ